jgi:hypothetical protein
METQVRTPQMVFMQPQRLVVPLFQRPYVWNEENQWEPLWNDVVRVTDRVLARQSERHHPHFLGRCCAAASPKANRPNAGANRHRRPTALDNLALLVTRARILERDLKK